MGEDVGPGDEQVRCAPVIEPRTQPSAASAALGDPARSGASHGYLIFPPRSVAVGEGHAASWQMPQTGYREKFLGPEATACGGAWARAEGLE